MAELITRRDGSFAPGPGSVLIFDHIPKCGGTSMAVELLAAVEGPCHNIYDGSQYLQLDLAAERPALIWGHSAWGCHEFLPADLRAAYFTMLRDPFRLAVSHYHYNRSILRTDVSLDEYLLGYPPNFLIDHLGGGSLERARRRLYETYVCYGVVERYDESLRRIAQAFSLGRLQGERVNVSRKSGVQARPDIVQRFYARNADDFAFYEEALRRFDAAPAAPAAQPPATAATGPAAAQQQQDMRDAKEFPRTRELLDAGDHEAALRDLLAEEHGSLREDEAELAIRLAIRLRRGRLARLLIEKLRAILPYRANRYLEDLFASTGDHDACAALLAEEIAVWDRYAATEPDAWTNRFRLNSMLRLADHLHAAGRGAEAQALIAECAEKHAGLELALPALAEAWRAAGEPERALAFAAGLDRARLCALSLLRIDKAAAHSLYEAGRLAEAQELLARLVAEDPLDLTSLARLLVTDRRLSRPLEHQAQARAALRTLGDLRCCFQLRKELAVNVFAHGDRAEAEALLAELFADSGGERRKAGGDDPLDIPGLAFTPFAELGDPGELLVIRSGPLPAYEFLRRALLDSLPPHDLLAGPAPEVPEPGVRRRFVFPSARFNMANDFARLFPAGGPRYATVLVILSTPHPGACDQIWAMARSLCDGAVRFYAFDQLFSPHRRLFLYSMDAQPAEEPEPPAGLTSLPLIP